MFNRCPKCGKAALPLFKKLSIKYDSEILCQNCNTRLILPKWTKRFHTLYFLAVCYLFLSFPNIMEYSRGIGFVFISALVIIALTAGILPVPLVEKD